MTDIAETLKERGTRYGEFAEHAHISQCLKAIVSQAPSWESLDCDMRESIEMIMHKVARILNGDPDYHDSWHDISGYAKLVADRLKPIDYQAIADRAAKASREKREAAYPHLPVSRPIMEVND